MSIESAADWIGLRRVGRVVERTLDALESAVRVGVTTAELDAIASAALARGGARSAPALEYGFPGSVLISVNDEVVHGVPGPRRLAQGDLVTLDVTAECEGYVADAARTVTVGSAGDVAVRLRTAAEAAFRRALTVARVGRRVNEIGRAIEHEVRTRGFTPVAGVAGHGVGRAVHEEPTVANEFVAWQRDVLTEGLVIAIEPIICAGAPEIVVADDGWTVKTRDGSLAAHYEHTVVVTRRGPVVLTGRVAA